jgi:adenylate kinase
VPQVEFLDSVLAEQGAALDRVIEMVVDTEEVVGRLVARAAEAGREDDSEDVIRYRQVVYAKETAPLTTIYQERDLLVQVDGMGSVDEVARQMAAAVDAADE